MSISCKSCGKPIPPGKTGGRPRDRCSPGCDQAWSNARRRASRARLSVITFLDQAQAASQGLDPSLNRKLATVRRWVDARSPAELVQVLVSDLVPPYRPRSPEE
jgi:predicted nucleic acid-binding Zn ribbon protein